MWNPAVYNVRCWESICHHPEQQHTSQDATLGVTRTMLARTAIPYAPCFFLYRGFNSLLFFCSAGSFLLTKQTNFLHAPCQSSQMRFLSVKKYRQYRAAAECGVCRYLWHYYGDSLPGATRNTWLAQIPGSVQQLRPLAHHRTAQGGSKGLIIWHIQTVVLALDLGTWRAALRGVPPARRKSGHRILPGPADARSGSPARYTCCSPPREWKLLLLGTIFIRSK